jgi:hypothetical protein
MRMAKKVTRSGATNFKNQAFLAPNRTIDESPAGGFEGAQNPALSDPFRAPGQNRRSNRAAGNREQRADEAYGAMEIPDAPGAEERHGAGDLEKKSVDKSVRPTDPRREPEKQGEKERRGLEREFGQD